MLSCHLCPHWPQLSGQPRRPRAPRSRRAPAGARGRRAPERRRHRQPAAGKPVAGKPVAGGEAQAGRAPGPPRQSGRARAGTRRSQPSPGAGGRDPGEAPGSRRSRRGACGCLGRGPRAPATGAPLTQLRGVRLSLRLRSVRPGRRLPRAARCPSRGPQLAVTGRTTSTRSPHSLKSTASHRPLICIPGVAPRSPVRAPLRPRALAAGSRGTRAAPRGRGGWVRGGAGPGDAAEPRRSSDFSQRDFPGSSDISNLGASFPPLSGSAHSPISSGSRACSVRGEVRGARAPRLAGAPSLSLALSAEDSQPLPRRLPLPAGEDAAPPAARAPRRRRRRRRCSAPGLPPYITRRLIIIEAARLNPLPAGRARRWHRPPTAPCPLPAFPAFPALPDFLLRQLSTKKKHVWHGGREGGCAPLPSRRPAQPGPTGPLKCQGAAKKNPAGAWEFGWRLGQPSWLRPGCGESSGPQPRGVRAAGTGTPPP